MTSVNILGMRHQQGRVVTEWPAQARHRGSSLESCFRGSEEGGSDKDGPPRLPRCPVPREANREFNNEKQVLTSLSPKPEVLSTKSESNINI